MLRRACFTVLALVLLPATVQAFDHHHHHHDSDSDGGGGCSSSSSSEHTSPTPAPTVTAQRPGPVLSSAHKRVFVTSSGYWGAVGGLAAADMYCQTAATAAGLTGTYRAWLSSGTTNAYDRIDDVSPWYTTDDSVAFASKSDLRGSPRSTFLDERGGYASVTPGSWSGSDAQGNATGDDCEGWTNATADASARTGSALASDVMWGGGDSPLSCDSKTSLICFQQ